MVSSGKNDEPGETLMGRGLSDLQKIILTAAYLNQFQDVHWAENSRGETEICTERV